MLKGVAIFLLAMAFVAVGWMAIYRDAKQPLPKNLPPPLKDDDEEE